MTGIVGLLIALIVVNLFTVQQLNAKKRKADVALRFSWFKCAQRSSTMYLHHHGHNH
jgi:hypothetical protein